MKRTLAVLAMICAGSSVAAQDFRAGAAVHYAMEHSGDTQGGFSVLANLMFGNTAFKYGGELDAAIAVTGVTDYAATRIRFLAGYDFGQYTLLMGAGSTNYQFESDEESDGVNAGFGLQYEFSDRYDVRGEFVRDFMDKQSPDVTTTRVGVFFHF